MTALPRFDLKGRIALVTGASSGLGVDFARGIAAAGAAVVVAARRTERLERTVADIEAAGGRALAVPLDVTVPASVRACFAAVEARWGTVDLVVNNAGIAVSKTVTEQTEEDWDAVVDTNLKGAWLVAQEAARRMIAAGRPGAIVNIASITGERVAGGAAPYCASKAGLIHLTRALALELARHGIRVNALAPGYIDTELNHEFLASAAGERLLARIPLRRLGRPEELLGAMLLLASDAGSFITGSVLAVDGGHLVSTL